MYIDPVVIDGMACGALGWVGYIALGFIFMALSNDRTYRLNYRACLFYLFVFVLAGAAIGWLWP